MKVRLSAYLKRNRYGIFYFRRVVPPDLRPQFAFTQISRSLRTCSRVEAKSQALHYSASIELIFSKLREMKKKSGFQTDYTVTMKFENESFTVTTDAKPEETETVSRVVPELIRAARGQVRDPLKPVGPPLWSEIDKYLDEQERAGTWSEQSIMDIRGDFRQFKTILGDGPVSMLTHDRLNDAKDKLMRLPASINKLAETRNKTIDDILALNLPAQSPVNAKKKWGRLITFFDWLEGKGLIEKNYAKGKKIKAKEQSYERFSPAELTTRFESDEYRRGFKEPFQFWLPLLGLFTGARIEELAQVHLADIT